MVVVALTLLFPCFRIRDFEDEDDGKEENLVIEYEIGLRHLAWRALERDGDDPETDGDAEDGEGLKVEEVVFEEVVVVVVVLVLLVRETAPVLLLLKKYYPVLWKIQDNQINVLLFSQENFVLYICMTHSKLTSDARN